MGGSGPPTSVQTPPEICVLNPLKSVLYIGGVSHVCNFLLLTSKEKLFGPPTLFGLATPLGRTSGYQNPTWIDNCPMVIKRDFLENGSVTNGDEKQECLSLAGGFLPNCCWEAAVRPVLAHMPNISCFFIFFMGCLGHGR